MRVVEMHINKVPDNLKSSFKKLDGFRKTESREVIGAFADLMQIAFITESNMKNCMNCNQALLAKVNELEEELRQAIETITGEVE